jgi:rhamnose transport system permease protein
VLANAWGGDFSGLWRRSLLRWDAGLVVVVIAIIIFGALTSQGEFFTSSNWFNAGVTNGEYAIMALPMTLIVISGEIDLSVASILGMSSSLLGFLWMKHWPMLAIFAALLVMGAVAGLINGLLVTRVGLPSLAVTIGTLALYRGIATIVLGSASVTNFPLGYAEIGVNPVPHLGIPYNIAIFIVLAIIFGVVLHATPLGRSIYAIGNNTETALFSGIRVKRIKTGLFMTSGVICAIAGALWTFRLSTAVQNNGFGAELDVIAIVLLAGVSIFGGKGSIPGVVLAFVAFTLLQDALLLTNFNQEAYGIVVGALLLVSVFVPQAGELAAKARSLKAIFAPGRPRSPGPALPGGSP